MHQVLGCLVQVELAILLVHAHFLSTINQLDILVSEVQVEALEILVRHRGQHLVVFICRLIQDNLQVLEEDLLSVHYLPKWVDYIDADNVGVRYGVRDELKSR